MTSCVPEQWLSSEHADRIRAGVAVAGDLMARAFPPHPDDPFGTLAAFQLERSTNEVVRAELVAVTGGADRLWWLQGLVLGFCDRAAGALSAASDLNATDVYTDVRGLADHVVEHAAEEKKAAAVIVFDLLRAVLDRDQVATAWALQQLFVPDARPDASAGGRSGGQAHSVRVKAVCTAAMLAACACAQIELGAQYSG